MIDQSVILQALRNVNDPELERDLVDLNMITGIEIQDYKVVVHFKPDIPACPIIDKLTDEIRHAVLQIADIHEVEILIDRDGDNKLLNKGGLPFGGIGHLNKINKVIAVMSGKCRARKCVVSSLIAIYLRRAGYRVGLLDMDISDRNICKMFFPHRLSPSFTPRAMLPAVTYTGIKLMALSVHLPENSTSLNFRSPLVLEKIKELTANVFWGDLDYLIVDMPSGTADGPNEILHSMKADGVILVTSPHDLDGLVIKKTAALVEQSGIHILGLVENVSNLDASDREFADVVFTPGHFDATAKSLHLPILGRIPVEPGIAALCDQGRVEECQAPAFEVTAQWVIKNV